MPINCEICLSRISAVYHTGEHITGWIDLVAGKKPLHVEALSISLRCHSTVGWQEVDRSLPQIVHNDSEAIREPDYINYTGDKLYLDQTQQLLQGIYLLPRGIKRCIFDFQLPSELPGMCRLPLGRTSYTLQVRLQRYSKHHKIYQKSLCVKQRIELRDLRPATSSSVSLRLHLSRSSYVPGQRIAFEVQPTEPATCRTCLCQVITYRSEHPAVKEKRVQRVLDESSDSAGVLHLPLCTPLMTQLQGEPIEISYFVEAGSNLCRQPLRLPLWVGTVAPPIDAPADARTDSPALGYDNLALNENDSLGATICERPRHSFHIRSRRSKAKGQGDHLRKLRRPKKPSYVLLAWRYFSDILFPRN
ncbi:uncharacterized protein LOC6572633 [Drosophila mojavensis]|uniref:Arrestin C-terminal-like domain-containing protein n=1 Tax=Drosophila mojavensis TaxID=7230 RepID=B4K6T4_DROMO|nr:uncharacterized protein LOC6572633 [Drosophila mojavensis]EDW14200.1 uncharacterized protein Dmoj_GI23462 [Drosophila mojavensis]